jgi:DNA-binding CsgD family transcriptional regulator
VIVRPVLCRPFVGRADELAYLRERRLAAGASHGGLVLIAGDAGVGKSRLIAEFCDALAYSRWKVGAGACVEFASRPYGPILEIFSRIDPGGLALGGAASKREQFDAIGDRLVALAAKTALVLVVEDLHWADAATLDLLTYLGPKLERMRVLVLASLRADELHPDHPAAAATTRIARAARAGRIDLGPLRGAELRTFIDAALDDIPLPDETRRAIALAGEGNPFFTEELLKSAVEREPVRDRAARHALPPTVRATLLERLRPFDDDERRVVTQAAVIGRTFGLGLLAATLRAEPASVLPVLRRARDYQLVEEVSPATFRFRHGLTRDAIYGDFLGAELQQEHRTIALALECAPERERSVEALAYHWWAAADGARAAHYNEAAGDAAGAVHAHEDAIAFYVRALEFAGEPLARGTLSRKIGDRRLALGATKEAQATFSAAAESFAEAGLHEREASCRVSAAITAYGTRMSHPTGPLEAMLSRLAPGEYRARSSVHLGLAWLLATFSFPTQAEEHLRAVDPRALAEAPDAALRFHNVSAFVAMTVGDLERFRGEHRLWIECARAGGSLSVLAGAHTNGAMAYAFFGLHDEAEEQLARAIAAAREARSLHGEESAYAFAAMCALLRGDLKRAREALERVSAASDNHVNITFATAWGTLIAAALDDRALIAKWFDGFEATLVPAPEVECGAGFAEILVRRGRAEEAARVLHHALPDCEMIRGNVYTLLAAARHARAPDRAKARSYLERAAAAPVETPERAALALFDAYEAARAGDGAAARDLAQGAAEGFARLRYPLFEAAAREAAGENGAALDLYRRCGAVADVARLEGRRDTRSDGAGDAASGPLSAREREIAELAEAGRSNLEIARTLAITHKTVEKHLASIYRKLGISSRIELRAPKGH